MECALSGFYWYIWTCILLHAVFMFPFDNGNDGDNNDDKVSNDDGLNIR